MYGIDGIWGSRVSRHFVTIKQFSDCTVYLNSLRFVETTKNTGMNTMNTIPDNYAACHHHFLGKSVFA